FRTAKLDVAMAEECQPTHHRGHVTVRLRDFERLAESDDGTTNVALKKRNQTEFATSPVGPRGITERLRERLRLPPGLLGERRVEILIRLALDDQDAEAKSLVGLDERIFQVFGQPGRRLRHCHSRQRAAEGT